MKKYRYSSVAWIAAIGFTASLVVVVPAAFAQTPGSNGMHGGWGPGGVRGGSGMGMMVSGVPGVFGTVTAINGDTLTVTSKSRVRPEANGSNSDGGADESAETGTSNATGTVTVYSVDATNAKVFKNGTSSTVGAITVNDTVIVQGTVNGTNVVATVIRDGVVPGPGIMKPGEGGKGFGFGRGATSTPIQGNGQPVIGGKLTVINGNALTVTTASNVIYAVDATNAKFIKNGTSTPLGNAVVGDNVIVQGAVNGTAVTASSIIDQGSGVSSGTPTRGPPEGADSVGVGAGAGGRFGFLGGIGNFFKHLFGF